MNSTTIKYQPNIRKTYVSPWIHVRELDLRGRMLEGSIQGDADGTGKEQGDTEGERAKFSNPFESDFFDYGYDDQSQY